MSVYNLKDLIRINQEAGEDGQLRDPSGLDFTLSMFKTKKGWLFELSHLVRSIIIDYPFIDGNKRTAYILCTLYFQDNNHEFDKDKLVEIIYIIAKKNITNINNIGRYLLKC